MFAVEVYAAVRRFVFIEGNSRREAARVFGLSRETGTQGTPGNLNAWNGAYSWLNARSLKRRKRSVQAQSAKRQFRGLMRAQHRSNLT